MAGPVRQERTDVLQAEGHACHANGAEYDWPPGCHSLCIGREPAVRPEIGGGVNPPQTTARIEAPEGRLVLGRYRLLRRLGAGGFGVVWLGRDEHLEREVAVKVMARDEDAETGRASREARAAARLNHPGIVALYELAEDEHDAYIVSELVPGRTMAELASERALSDRDVARIGSALCDALAHAHARGVIHRDVKPGNVMVVDAPAAGAGFAKLADFGVAHMATGDPLTRTGDVVGTLAYMAPEQAEGHRATPACDVYSLALSLYEVWTGENPVRGGGPLATARRLGRPLPPLGHKRSDLPVELCEIVDDALDPDPEVRPEPAELATELSAAEPHLADEGGLVEHATRERVGLTEATRRLSRSPAAHRRGACVAAGGLPAAVRVPVSVRAPAALRGAPPRPRRPPGGPRAPPGPWPGLLVLAALGTLGPTPPFSPVTAALVVARAGGPAPADRLDRLRAGAAGLAGLPGGRPRGDRPAAGLRADRRCRCCCPGRGCCGRCPSSLRCWGPPRSRPPLWPRGAWPRPRGAAPAWPPRASCGWRQARRCRRPAPVRLPRRHGEPGAVPVLDHRRAPPTRCGRSCPRPRWPRRWSGPASPRSSPCWCGAAPPVSTRRAAGCGPSAWWCAHAALADLLASERRLWPTPGARWRARSSAPRRPSRQPRRSRRSEPAHPAASDGAVGLL